MKLTRREFGLAMLAGLGAMFFWRMFSRLGGIGRGAQTFARARFWSRADHLAG